MAQSFNSNPIFTITTFNLIGEPRKVVDREAETGEEQEKRWRSVERTRTVGFYHEFELAEQVAMANSMDLNEDGYYSHIVIERVEPGLYPDDPISHRWFYKWDQKTETYIKLENFEDPIPDIISYQSIG